MPGWIVIPPTPTPPLSSHSFESRAASCNKGWANTTIYTSDKLLHCIAAKCLLIMLIISMRDWRFLRGLCGFHFLNAACLIQARWKALALFFDRDLRHPNRSESCFASMRLATKQNLTLYKSGGRMTQMTFCWYVSTSNWNTQQVNMVYNISLIFSGA